VHSAIEGERTARPALPGVKGFFDSPTGEEWVSLVRVLMLLTFTPAVWLGIIPNAAETNSIVLLLGGYVILLTVGPRWIPALRKPDLIVVLDILVITFVVTVSGTLNSPFLYLYYLVILEAAHRLNTRQALAAAMAMAAIVVILWMRANHAELLGDIEVRLGAFTGGGFFLALFFGMLVQEGKAARTLAGAYDTTLEGWSRALDLRDKATEGHTQRVTELTLSLARAVGVPEAGLVHIRRGALLHDIGKMGIPDGILHKPGPLTEEESEIMHRHPSYAYELLSPIAYLRPALDIPYCHHEKWDGSGYPRGLRGEEIPLAARIFAIADVWDALRWDRPYRPSWTIEKTKEYMREQAGVHFDPHIVDVFLRMITRESAAESTGLGSRRRDGGRPAHAIPRNPPL
jgi:putative nucleotidyltransferase with HDIG domain